MPEITMDFTVIEVDPLVHGNIGEWGLGECQIQLLNYNGRERPYQWLVFSNECAKRMHRALGDYLAKKAHDGSA